jgi:Zn finger protein HypA/HybF involved in hydrogenase expression
MNFLRRLFSKAKQPEPIWVQCDDCGAIQDISKSVKRCPRCGSMESGLTQVTFCDIHHIYYEAGNVCGQCLSEGDRS